MPEKKSVTVATKKKSILSRSIEHAIAVTNDELSDEAEQSAAEVLQISPEQIKINQEPYLIVTNHQNGLDLNRLALRYNSVLQKYDYIVGDWGYGQLRLRGFYDNNRIHAKIDQKINTLQDYLLEYCNFGCAYFVLEREQKAPEVHKQLIKKRNIQKKYANQHKVKPTEQQFKRRSLKKTPVVHSRGKVTKKSNFKIRNLKQQG